MASEATYRTITGVVKFPPRDGEIDRDGEKIAVRNVLVRQTGVTKNEAQDVRLTLWPSHAHVTLEPGESIQAEGRFTTNKGKDADDNPVTYLNLSVSGILKFGKLDTGDREATATTSTSSDTDDDDEPW